MNAATPIRPSFARHRRNDFDVTNTVQVSSTVAVTAAVCELFAAEWPQESLEPIRQALTTFEALFTGRMPGYNGVDTVYHDRQHSLDVMLAMARLLVGHERSVGATEQLGFERAAMGFVLAAFHDAGYIREIGDPIPNGALYTSSHVSRSAKFLEQFLPTIGMESWIPVATQVVHYSGYEVPFSEIDVADPRDHRVGHLLGTADLIAQMSDRCYLEKCRDRLYPEFVLAGTATARTQSGGVHVRYGSGLDLLRHTPNFVATMMRDRLDGQFGAAYRYLEPLFDGENPYLLAIQQHMTFLQRILQTENWRLLRRNPPCFTYDPNPLPSVRQLMLLHLRDLWAKP
ncbi:MAG: hypothetical protein NTZ79_09750 [Proteobacteria bacterium]|nr:hypothetical protein [Pseudomonadota bacterium]